MALNISAVADDLNALAAANKGDADMAPKNAPKTATKGTSAVTTFDNIPMPEDRKGVEKYPWDTINPGQSFFVPEAKLATFHTSCSKRNVAQRKDNPEAPKFWIAREYVHEGTAGVMVWRKA